MYKIYINDTPLVLMETKEVSNAPAPSDHHLIARYTGKRKFLFSYIDMLEKSSRYERVSLHSNEVENLFNDFQSNYKIIEAAGGMVFNPKGDLLLIFRRGSWDLPKGKIDPGESTEMAAIREVQEETGLHTLKIEQPISVTYHTYKNGKGKRILKLTHWFKMFTEESALVPQAEEDIEQAIWMGPKKFLAEKKEVYGNIKDLIEGL